MHAAPAPSWLRAATRAWTAWAAAVARLLALACLLWASVAHAHPPVDCVAVLRVKPAGDGGGVIEIDVTHDALAFVLNDTSRNIPDGPMLELLSGPDADIQRLLDAAKDRFQSLCEVLVDGVRVPVLVVTMPTAGDVRDWQRRHSAYPLPIRLELSARASFAADARGCTIKLPDTLGDAVLVVERAGAEPVAMPLTAGERSPAFPLLGRDDAAGRGASGLAQSGDVAAGPSTWSVLERFCALGFAHIIPDGPDHALFVLGLFLLVPRVKPVLVQVSAFTLAHTLTLSLTAVGLIGAPARLIEPAIALSIAFVAMENLCVTRVTWRRSLAAFAFGLLHGMGVASAFSEAGFPPGRLVASLAAFTVGVEAGHIATLAGAFLLLGWCRARPWYRSRVALPLSLVISAIALVWFAQRVAWVPG